MDAATRPAFEYTTVSDESTGMHNQSPGKHFRIVDLRRCSENRQGPAYEYEYETNVKSSLLDG